MPDPADSHFHADAQANPAKLIDVLKNGQLARLDFGIFALHAAQMAMFVVVPVALKNSGLAVDDHWAVYLPVLLGSFALMVPAIIVGEKRGRMKPLFIGAVALMLLAQLGFAFGIDHFWGIVWALFLYFVAFNLLEASLPSLISKLAPASAKGTAMGVYNTAQALGLFFGGVLGGWLAQHHGFQAVFIFCVVLMGAWLVVSLSMAAPPAIKTRMFRVGAMPANQAALLKMQLAGGGGRGRGGGAGRRRRGHAQGQHQGLGRGWRTPPAGYCGCLIESAAVQTRTISIYVAGRIFGRRAGTLSRRCSESGCRQSTAGLRPAGI